MSSENPSLGEDADESPDRPDGVSDKEDEEPDIDDSEEEDEDSTDRTDAAPPSGNSGEQPERSGESPVSEKRDPRCQSSGAPETGSSSTGSGGGNRLFSWIQNRTIRRGVFVDPARDNFRTMTSLYSSMNPAVESVNLSTQTHGAVFNLEYSPDG